VKQSANHNHSLWWELKTAPWEFQIKLLHHFFLSNDQSSLHFTYTHIYVQKYSFNFKIWVRSWRRSYLIYSSWISRSKSFPVRSFECRGLHLLTWKLAWKFSDSRKNVFDMLEDSCENSFEILAVVIILSPISPVDGTSLRLMPKFYLVESSLQSI